MSNDKVYISLVNHIEEKIGPLVNVLVINLESNLTSDAGALTRSLVRNIKMRRGDKQKANLGSEHQCHVKQFERKSI